MMLGSGPSRHAGRATRSASPPVVRLAELESHLCHPRSRRQRGRHRGGPEAHFRRRLVVRSLSGGAQQPSAATNPRCDAAPAGANRGYRRLRLRLRDARIIFVVKCEPEVARRGKRPEAERLGKAPRAHVGGGNGRVAAPRARFSQSSQQFRRETAPETRAPRLGQHVDAQVRRVEVVVKPPRRPVWTPTSECRPCVNGLEGKT